MKNKSIMIQGTASTVGKSLINTAFCRIFTQDGFNVNPFKSQNMSLNSYITADGDEMGRAQVVQAEACNKLPNVKMNPILLKPSSDKKSQVILNGKVYKYMEAIEYFNHKKSFIPQIKCVYNELLADSDIVVIEGAGSPAEINLKENDIVNMGMAEIANSPVILVGDIDKGGVFASLVGTLMLLEPQERERVKGIIINKFRGDVSLLEPGIKQVEKMTGVPVLGVVPMLDIDIEDEDSGSEIQKYKLQREANLDIAVINLPYISNFTDINSLSLEPMTNIRYVKTAEELGEPDIIVIPGTKSTITALNYINEMKLGDKIIEAFNNGSFCFGICGGYQIMGNDIIDEECIESDIKFSKGLGLLDIKTSFEVNKKTVLSEGTESIFGEFVQGYEIHMGMEKRNRDAMPFIIFDNGVDGAVNNEKTLIGTYFHGIFENGAFTRKYLNYVRRCKGRGEYNGDIINWKKYKSEQYDKLADAVRKNVDMEKVYRIVRDGI